MLLIEQLPVTGDGVTVAYGELNLECDARLDNRTYRARLHLKSVLSTVFVQAVVVVLEPGVFGETPVGLSLAVPDTRCQLGAL